MTRFSMIKTAIGLAMSTAAMATASTTTTILKNDFFKVVKTCSHNKQGSLPEGDDINARPDELILLRDAEDTARDGGTPTTVATCTARCKADTECKGFNMYQGKTEDTTRNAVVQCFFFKNPCNFGLLTQAEDLAERSAPGDACNPTSEGKTDCNFNRCTMANGCAVNNVAPLTVEQKIDKYYAQWGFASADAAKITIYAFRADDFDKINLSQVADSDTLCQLETSLQPIQTYLTTHSITLARLLEVLKVLAPDKTEGLVNFAATYKIPVTCIEAPLANLCDGTEKAANLLCFATLDSDLSTLANTAKETAALAVTTAAEADTRAKALVPVKVGLAKVTACLATGADFGSFVAAGCVPSTDVATATARLDEIKVAIGEVRTKTSALADKGTLSDIDQAKVDESLVSINEADNEASKASSAQRGSSSGSAGIASQVAVVAALLAVAQLL